MELLKKLVPIIIREQLSKFSNRHTKYIFYRIIDVNQSMKKYTLQCINTCSIFYASLADIVSDKNIIYRLHPIQTCYMGIEYANRLKEIEAISIPRSHPDIKNFFRGTYHLCYQDRKRNVCFVNRQTKEEFIMDPRDIVLSEALIGEFDTVQTFHIGLLAGLKMHDTVKEERCKVYDRLRRPYLWLVK